MWPFGKVLRRRILTLKYVLDLSIQWVLLALQRQLSKDQTGRFFSVGIATSITERSNKTISFCSQWSAAPINAIQLSIMSYSKGSPPSDNGSTNATWKVVGVLKATIENMNCPYVFLTFSAADMKWHMCRQIPHFGKKTNKKSSPLTFAR